MFIEPSMFNNNAQRGTKRHTISAIGAETVRLTGKMASVQINGSIYKQLSFVVEKA